jgi:hypothetical protein
MWWGFFSLQDQMLFNFQNNFRNKPTVFVIQSQIQKVLSAEAWLSIRKTDHKRTEKRLGLIAETA